MYKRTELTHGLKAGHKGNTGLVSGQGCLLSPGLGLWGPPVRGRSGCWAGHPPN